MAYFKDFDTKYPQNTFLEGEDREALLEAAGAIKRWEHGYFQPTQQRVVDAVYSASTAEEWQRFRVSMKGQPTSVKLVRLEARWAYNTIHRHSEDEEFKLECIRIMNYIGALKRGGQLNDDLEIIT
jgi:alkylated DNA repair dioxygenase AlkB